MWYLKETISFLLKALIIVYQYIFSPILGPSCRFYPTCSEYGLESIKLHGPFFGTILAIRRIIRCNPWGRHGYDPVLSTCASDNFQSAPEQTPHKLPES
ncbi:MAG: membrane protein insertion efficiency factor YidD [Alphaproteobacteria bacterium]|jgi:putative membrane protein insertion efficiency factor|nr:membrane protein insertion efficiency factor YidD [Alphaproteobacteria bacterium]PPR14702.1 MAG: putative membrane protein insertion efficiency factor [Alphaproteobacteria bacterium MarineAlpha12_Bin1]